MKDSLVNGEKIYLLQCLNFPLSGLAEIIRPENQFNKLHPVQQSTYCTCTNTLKLLNVFHSFLLILSNSGKNICALKESAD
jgi:hypothetical protein